MSSYFLQVFGQTRLDTTSTQFGTMADGDSEVVFGKGRPTLEHEPTSGVDLFARSNTDDTREPSRTLDEAPLQSSTPMVVRLPEAGDTLQAQENPTTETQTCHLSRPPKMVVRPETYSGKGDWSEYLSHFSDCAELGGWNDREKCLVLAANLREISHRTQLKGKTRLCLSHGCTETQVWRRTQTGCLVVKVGDEENLRNR